MLVGLISWLRASSSGEGGGGWMFWRIEGGVWHRFPEVGRRLYSTHYTPSPNLLRLFFDRLVKQKDHQRIEAF